MSFAEFTYPLMQAWDWWHLYQHGVQIQIGGSDQYGNILAGIDAVKYVAKTHHSPEVRDSIKDFAIPIGFTTPLLTTSSGDKFGKSAGNAIWLDSDMTSHFDLYQVRHSAHTLQSLMLTVHSSSCERLMMMSNAT